jgi:hypothetical protein
MNTDIHCNYFYDATKNRDEFYVFSNERSLLKDHNISLKTQSPRSLGSHYHFLEEQQGSRNLLLTDNAGGRRYMHRITLKKPLKHLEGVSHFTNSDREKYLTDDIDNYSGYLVIKNNGEQFFLINPNDIATDTIVFDYLGDKTEDQAIVNLDEEEYIRLSDKRMEALEEWLEEDKYALYGIFDKKPLVHPSQKSFTLYRGLSFNTKEDFDEFVNSCKTNKIIGKTDLPTSWTSNICVANLFARQFGDYGVILRHRFKSEDIMVDTRMIDPQVMQKLYPSIQREIIIKPGEYSCEIYMSFEFDNVYDKYGENLEYLEIR